MHGGTGTTSFVTLYRKTPKYSDPRKMAVIILKFEQCGSTIDDADRIANSADPDQTVAPLGAV